MAGIYTRPAATDSVLRTKQ